MHRIVLLTLAVSGAAAQTAPGYTADLAPVLERRCGGCHAAEAKMGEFSINSFETLMRGGNHGVPVVKGRPDESLLYQMITGKAYPRMPMDGTVLTDGETALIRAWIAAGARGPLPGEAPKPVSAAAGAVAEIRPRTPVKPQIYAMAWQPGGNLIALAGHRKVTLVDPATSKAAGLLLGTSDPVRSVAFSGDGKLLAAAGGPCAKKGEIVLYRMDSRSASATITGHDDCVYAAAWSPDGKLLATASYDKLIKLWDTSSGSEVRTLKDHIDAVYAVEFTPDGKRLISGGADRTVKIWDPATGQRLYTLSEATDAIHTVAVDPTGRYAAAGGQDRSIRVWKLGETGADMVQSLMAHQDAILKLVWSPDGKTIASSSADRTIRVFGAGDLTELRIIPNQPEWAYGLQFSPDGRRLAIGRLDGTFTFVSLALNLTATSR